MRIDSHQHFWDYDPTQYNWIKPGSVLERSYLPVDLWKELEKASMDGCIAVQARQSLQENDFLLDLAVANPFIKGVVGWIDLQSEVVEEQAGRFAEHNKAVGVRHVVQDETDPNFMKRPAFRRGISTLESRSLTYDILIYWHQMDDAIDLVRSFPNQKFVLDHIAKPSIVKQLLHPWRAQMIALSGFPNVSCKVSGMITEADHEAWTPLDLKPYWETVLEAFGPQRLLFGSDWPVIRLAGEYQEFVETVNGFIEPLSEEEKSAIMGNNAAKIYGV